MIWGSIPSWGQEICLFKNLRLSWESSSHLFGPYPANMENMVSS